MSRIRKNLRTGARKLTNRRSSVGRTSIQSQQPGGGSTEDLRLECSVICGDPPHHCQSSGPYTYPPSVPCNCCHISSTTSGGYLAEIMGDYTDLIFHVSCTSCMGLYNACMNQCIANTFGNFGGMGWNQFPGGWQMPFMGGSYGGSSGGSRVIPGQGKRRGGTVMRRGGNVNCPNGFTGVDEFGNNIC